MTTILEQFINKYVVLDLETNGLRRVNDDILSITIFDPSRGIAWNRLLPLELQPIVLNSYIHGITDDMLKNKNSLSQEEFNKITDAIANYNNVIKPTIDDLAKLNSDEEALELLRIAREEKKWTIS